MPRKQMPSNSNRAGRVASKVQTLVAEILRDDYSDDKLLAGVSLVGAVAHGGLQFVRLFYYSRDKNIPAVQQRLDAITRMVRFELAARMNQKYVPRELTLCWKICKQLPAVWWAVFIYWIATSLLAMTNVI